MSCSNGNRNKSRNDMSYETHPIWPGKFRFLDLEVEEPRQSDCIEEPGSETGNINAEGWKINKAATKRLCIEPF
jgi:hypothetical protein